MKKTVTDYFQSARAIVLDFDGTLVDSNVIKLQGFDACFAQYAEAWPSIRAYCYTNNHTPRWEKFRYVYETFLKRPYTPEEEKGLLDCYASATTQRVREAPEVPGASAFLASLAKIKPLALLSSTPDDLLGDFLKHRHWDRFFQIVRGAPVKKASWITAWCQKQAWSTQDIIFVGDSPEDLQSARAANVPFIAVVNAQVGTQADGFLRDWTSWKAVQA